ncbi:MAG: hypothetical protein ACOC7P_03780, partial [Chloroflexota bacterium]
RHYIFVLWFVIASEAWQSPVSNSKHDCSATFQGRAIFSWHEAIPPAIAVPACAEAPAKASSGQEPRTVLSLGF